MVETTEVAKPMPSNEEKVERYNKVVGLANLQGVQMTRVGFDVKPDFFNDPSENKLAYSVERGESQYVSGEQVAIVNIKLTVDAKRNRKKTLSCEAHYIVIYDNLEDCDEDAVDVFLTRVAPFACYPYFRSLFANLDWAANTRLPPLPVHKEPPRSSKKAK
ncbi:hypothetical protein [Mesorhizobium sp. KR1-2]|uniref:hypothetical protein n=1 Tax=Mesorhizobium sp. KR1-2 TaxID=3156609 RepID=UPI0032B3B6E2